MSLPNYQQLMLPLLRRAVEKPMETRIPDLEEIIASDLSLAPEDISALLPSGKQTVFSNRLNWAKLYMAKAGLIESTRRGYFKVTERGQQISADKTTDIDVNFLMQFPEFIEWKSKEKSSAISDVTVSHEQSLDPEENIAVSAERLKRELSLELLERVHKFTPTFFERLIVELLLEMGYGGGRSEMGKALGKSGDGGIDGVIKEDELGLDVVYIQAKRYAADNAVPVREVRDFVGSLEGHRASKGVFVTTSTFPESAREYLSRVSKRVILIDGKELADLMIKHKVGVRNKDTYEINRIDEDFFVE